MGQFPELTPVCRQTTEAWFPTPGAGDRWPSISSVIPPRNATEYPWSISPNMTNKTLDVSQCLCAREAWERPATESHASRGTSPDPSELKSCQDDSLELANSIGPL